MTAYSGVDADTLTDVQLVLEAVNGLNVEAIAGLPIADALTCWAALEDANRILAGVRSEVTRLLADAMPEKQVTVDNVGTFVRHGKRDRTQWDKEWLLRDVLDSHRFDDLGTAIDETPLDRVLHVFNLPAPRVTALRERRLDPEQYCRSEFGGWSIEVLS